MTSWAQEDSALSGSGDFPQIYNSETEPGEPISPAEALASLRLPSGFKATLFAAEPEVQNPIAATTDSRGRVWVAENYTYAERAQKFDLSLNDRVIVLEDDDGDGVADRRTVFIDTVQMLTGITVGRGGVWLMCPPQLLFVPDADGDLVPDGPPQVKLDGFYVASENYHNFANGLSWGPDNWLYGRCGASCPGDMGLPGATDADRVPIRGGMWRYHPERQAFEALTQGTTNPWGHDWNEVGDLFFINTVNGHFWHAIPGAHFVRPHTLDVNPYVYELIDMHADHWHFDTGKSWTDSRAGAANDYGGGHAHIGMMIYQEPTWPEKYRGQVMTVNMHGRRVNTELLKPSGSGYVASHEPDFLLSDDTWFRGMEILPTPDGNALLIDWSDTGECHDSTGVHRTSGRIFKISFEAARDASENLPHALNEATRSDPLALAKLQRDGSSWESRRARELLAELYLGDEDISEAAVFLRASLFDRPDAPVATRLSALWGLLTLNAVDESTVEFLLQASEASLRQWGVRVMLDDCRIDMATGGRPADVGSVPTAAQINSLVSLAKEEPSAAVRLSLASGLQRLPYESRSELARALLSHAEDAEDHNLPLMVWYGLTPLGESHLDQLVDLMDVCQWPTTTRLLARRIADQSSSYPKLFNQLISTTLKRPETIQASVVLGIAEAMSGWRKADQPEGWKVLVDHLANVEDPHVVSALRNLNILFGDGRQVEELMQMAADKQAELELRMSALRSLVEARAEGTKSLCLQLLSERFLNTVAASGLARETDPSIGLALVKSYRRFHPSERPQVISILAARAEWAKALLKAVEEGQIDRSEISAFQARQIASFEDSELTRMLQEAWGQVRTSSADKRLLIEKLHAELTQDVLLGANRSEGRKLFEKTCSSCHKMFGQGGALGPELTGAQRSNLTYLLENIVDPSGVVTKEFRATVILLDDGRILTGLVTSQTDKVVTLGTQEKIHFIPTDEIVQMKQSDVSTMPEGLLEPMSPEQIRNLISYLQSTAQVALP